MFSVVAISIAHPKGDRLDKLTVDPESIQLAKTCPVCGAPMKFKEGKYGEFLGCSRYPNCKQTVRIPIIANC